jgi:3-dehydroquinate dehydratase-2
VRGQTPLALSRLTTHDLLTFPSPWLCSMLNEIHIINGPNLNLLGRREPEVYGSMSFESFLEDMRKDYPGVMIHYMQTNHEGVIIDYLHAHGFDEQAGFILNAGGFSHTSISIRDAVTSMTRPVVEVHISDIYKREPFRWHSYLTSVCVTHFIGFGLDGYRKATDFLLAIK